MPLPYSLGLRSSLCLVITSWTPAPPMGVAPMSMIKGAPPRPSGATVPTLLSESQHQVVKRAAERIKAFPETHDQDNWYGERGGFGEPTLLYLLHQSRQGLLDIETMAQCNTVACAAGHLVSAAIELGVDLSDTEFVSATAQRVGGLTDEQADILFYECTTRSARRAIARAAKKGRWRVGTRAALGGFIAEEMAPSKAWLRDLFGMRQPDQWSASSVGSEAMVDAASDTTTASTNTSGTRSDG